MKSGHNSIAQASPNVAIYIFDEIYFWKNITLWPTDCNYYALFVQLPLWSEWP
jgi:hypothetical protein